MLRLEARAQPSRFNVRRARHTEEPARGAASSKTRAAMVLAFDERGKLLLGRRRDTGRWTMPGGRVEDGETPRRAARFFLAEQDRRRVEIDLLGHAPGRLGMGADLDGRGEAVAEASGSSQMCSTAQPYGFGQLSVLSSVGINYDKPLDQLPLFEFPGSLARTMYLTVTKAIF